MIKVTVYWEDDEPEEYLFDNLTEAKEFYIDALSKCGQVVYSVEELED